jgi:ABC-type branched-subunit amino acid transport system substrate-binding protein
MRTIRALRPNAEAPQILRMSYAVGATVNVDAAVAQLQQYQRTHTGNPIKAIIMASTKLPAVKFIEKTHDAVPGLLYTNVSGVGASDFADELMLLGPAYANGNIVTQAVPAPDGYSSVVLDYKTQLSKYFANETPNYISLEGYMSAVVLIEGLRRAGPNLDAERLVYALEGIQNLDLGIGALVGFSRGDHQAIHKVWGTELDGTGHYKDIELE